VPSTSRMRPTMSSCHSCIARERSQRLSSCRRRRAAAAGSAHGAPAPGPKAHSEEGWNQHINRRRSRTYRGQCGPGPGAASRNCRPAAGATVESMSRSRTWAMGSQRCRECPPMCD
jgi:hypothetical protein